MNLERTNELIHRDINSADPYEALTHILELVLELVQLPDNEFCFSDWENKEEGLREVNKLLQIVREKHASKGIAQSLKFGRFFRLPLKFKLDVLFMGTGALQDLSIDSGWGDLFMKVAERYDQVANLLWPDSSQE